MNVHPEEKLSAYVDGELPPEEVAAVEAHLAGCAECRALVEDLEVLDRSGTVTISPDETSRFVEENRRRRAAQRGAPSRPYSRRYGLAAGIVAIAACALVVVFVSPAMNPMYRLSARVDSHREPEAVGYGETADRTIESLFAPGAKEESLGRNQAALSAGIY